MSSDTCATLTPSKAGSMRVVTRRVPGWRQAFTSPAQRQWMRGNRPRARKAGICTANCNAPPSITPPAMA